MKLIRLKRSDGRIQGYHIKASRLKLYKRVAKGLYSRISRGAGKGPSVRDFWVTGKYSRGDDRVVAVMVRAKTRMEVTAMLSRIAEAEGPTVSLNVSTDKPGKRMADAFYELNTGKNRLNRVF